MNKIAKNKKTLIGVSIAIALVSLLLMGGSIALIVYGANIVAQKIVLGIILIIAGALMTILFLGGIAFGLIFFFTGKSLVAVNGSIAEENLGKGTVNMAKCANCGEPVDPNDQFCGKCGTTTAEFKKCSKCEVLNKKDAFVCTACGEKLK